LEDLKNKSGSDEKFPMTIGFFLKKTFLITEMLYGFKLNSYG